MDCKQQHHSMHVDSKAKLLAWQAKSYATTLNFLFCKL
jgi:hypothetical protein